MRLVARTFLATGLPMLLVHASGAAAETIPRPREIRSPAPTGSGEPNLFQGDGKLYLSWLADQGNDSQGFQFSILHRGEWTTPRTIVTSDRLFANWADFPSVVELGDGSCVAHWLEMSGPDRYAYHVRIGRSRDGGKWSPATSPHRDLSPTEHGFVSLVPLAAGRYGVVWLDGRGFAGKEEHDPSAEMRLLWTQSQGEGFGDEVLLDGRVCDCCQTAAVATRRGVLVAYRDRSADEVRDISLVRQEGDRWTKPYPLAVDGWQIPGCPVNGPALDAAGDRVVAAWFTMHGAESLVQVALSSDGGAKFGAPRKVDLGNPLGRVDVSLLPSGDALVLWMETSKTGDASIHARRIGDTTMDEPFVVAASSAKRASGFPRVARLDQSLYFAWTDADSTSQVRIATLEIPPAWR